MSSRTLTPAFRGRTSPGFVTENRAVHGYLGIDPDIIWDIVESDIPALGRCVNDELDRRRVRPGHEQGRDLGDDLGLEL